jgi:hypothetical protein
MSDKSLASSWHNNDDGDTYFKDDGRGNEYISKKSESNTQRNKDHIHYFDNPPLGDKDHKDNYEIGERLSTNKSDKDPASNNLFDNFKDFLGLD